VFYCADFFVFQDWASAKEVWGEYREEMEGTHTVDRWKPPLLGNLK